MSRRSLSALGLLTLAFLFGPSARPTVAAEPTKTQAEPAAHAPAAAAAPAHAEAGHAAPGHAAAAEPNILEPQPSLAIWTVVVFLGLMFVLGKYAWKPLIEALHRREEHLEHVLVDTEKARAESERLLAEHRRQMAEAEDRARALLEEARGQARATAEEIVQKARAEAEAEQKRAQREIEVARDNALAEVWTKTADLAVSVAGKVLAKTLDGDDHRRLVEAAIHELPAAPASANGHGGHTA